MPFTSIPPGGFTAATVPDYGGDDAFANAFPEVVSPCASASTISPKHKSPMRTCSGRQAGVGRTLNMSPIQSPDDIDLGEDDGAGVTGVENFAPAVFNAAQMVKGQIALRAMAQLDMYGKKKNKAKAYNPKSAEYKAYCDIYFAMLPPDLIYQVTKPKFEAYLTYCFYREHKPRGRKKGNACNVAIDWMKANEVLKVYQSV